MHQRWQKYRAVMMVVVFIFAIVVGNGVLFPAPAKAIPTEVVASIPDTVGRVLTTIAQTIKAAAINAGTRMVTQALHKFAQDSAVWLATGSKGQGPLFQPVNFGKMVQDVGDQAVGAAIQELGSEAGMNLCKPPDIKVDLALRIGLRTQFTTPGGNGPATPNCTLSAFTKNWNDAASSKFFSGGSLSKAFNATLKGDDQSDFGFYTQATEKIAGRVLQQQAAATQDRQEGQGFKTKTTLISGQTQVPAQLVKETAQANTPDKAIADQKAQLNAAVAANDIKIFPSLLSVFLSTLSSNLIKRFQNQGISPDAGSLLTRGSSDLTSYDGSGLAALGRSAAENFFSYLTSAAATIQQKDLSLAGQLASCPDSPGMYNCRAGDDLIAAANQGLTIREALDKGMIAGDKQLIPPSAEKYNSLNNDHTCYQTAFCLNDVKVLRQVRILPVGFEIAVMNSNPDKPWRLKDVVDGFNNCAKVGSATVADPAHPYCHLIDPNWVLKIPAAKCNALAYSAVPLSEGVPDRLQDCVDLQTCVGYDSSGNCANYAYCTAEKNAWKFSADACDSQYATCRTLQTPGGKTVSYLYRTLDTGSCNAQNVGCAAYSLSQNSSGWQNPGYTSGNVVNNGAYFTSQLDTKSCAANSAGCTEFTVASSTSNSVHLTKAPDYLGCYDADPSTPGIQWPQTPADLNKISKNPACSDYAGVCIPEETSCSWYTPTAGGDRVPGRYTPAQLDGNTVAAWNDQCDAKCVGYDAYKEMPGNYSNGQDVAYIIPSSGQSCTVQDVGCTAFTNMSETPGDMEKTEYFTYLRPCALPSKDVVSQTYITYEGSGTAGYQLKTFQLVKDTDGSPKYFYRDPTELASYNAVCSEALYKAGVAPLSPDCRQFNDPSGVIYYRLLAKTIPVTNSCTPYRLNNPDLYVAANGTKSCLQNGTYKDGACFYYGLPGSAVNTAGNSQSCSAVVESCREYKGNTGNVVKEIFNDNFEFTDGAVPSVWSSNGASISSESTNITGHSLHYANSADVERGPMDLEPGSVYELSFWAKGEGNYSVWFFTDNDPSHYAGYFTSESAVLNLSDTWKEYHFTAVLQGTGSSLSTRIGFSGGAINHNIFLDNVHLVKITGYQYLVKKSLSVDPVCDSRPDDNLPGEALGCRAFTDTNNKPVYLTGFTSLCRENAIGCTALFDTHNTNDASGAAYNVKLTGQGGETKTLNFGAGDTPNCQIPVGKTSCYVTVKGHTRDEITNLDGVFDNSTVYIPPVDNSSNGIEYLVADKAGTCRPQDVGCVLAGKQVFDSPGNYHYETTTIKNDPSAYSKTLCTADAVDCNAFTDGAGTSYFKDPETNGQSICAYQTGVAYKGTTVSGWFQKNPAPSQCSKDSTRSCRVDADCSVGNVDRGTCVPITTPCYPNYVLSDGSYGILSYGNQGTGQGSTQYQNFVGECPAAANQCTEFVDHSDNNHPYYLIKDDKLGPGTCDGLVSQRAGCALFDETDVLNKKYDTKATYLASNLGSSTRNPRDPTYVDPIATDKNDANTIIQVTPDRECGEWLQCKQSYSVFDKATSKYRSICADLQRCTSGIHPGECGAGTDSAYKDNPLTQAWYVNRPLGWDKMEYDGYSLLDVYPLDELEQVNFSTNSPDWRLVYKVPTPDSSGSYCKNNGGDCGKANEGTCVNNVCVLSINGSKIPPEVDSPNQPPIHLCRAYPESTSPFPNTNDIKASPAFRQANVCSEDDINCECDYTKTQYGDSLNKYYSYANTSTTTPPGICQGGARNNQSCTADADCNNGKPVVGGTQGQLQQDGSCQLKTKEYNFVGWKGFCVEKDSSRTLNADEAQKECLTWWPIESLLGAADIYNQHTEAGYETPNQNGRFYCMNARGLSDQVLNLTVGTAGLGRQCDGGTAGDNYNASNCIDYGYGMPDFTKDWNGRNDYWFTTFDRAHINVQQETYGFGNSTYSGIDPGLKTMIREDIDQIQFYVVRSNSHYGNAVIPAGSQFVVLPNDTTAYTTKVPQAYYEHLGGDAGSQKTVATGYYYQGTANNGNDVVLVYGSNDGVTSLNKGGQLLSRYDARTNKGINANVFSGTSLPSDLWSGGSNIQSFCPTSGAPNWGEGGQNHGAWHVIKLHFDPTKHVLSTIDTAYCDGDYSDDAATSFNQQDSVTYQITFKTRKWCNAIANASVNQLAGLSASQRTTAWTNRLWDFFAYAIPGLGYTKDTINHPFGSINSSDPNGQAPILLSSLQYPRSSIDCGGAMLCTYNLGGQPTVYTGQNYSQFSSGFGYAYNHIGTIFAHLDSLYLYNTSTGQYAKVNPQSNLGVTTNFTGTGDPLDNTVTPVAPVIHPVINCKTQVSRLSASRTCEEDTTRQGFTINEVSGEKNVIEAQASSLKASLDFYMYADKNQMPIRQVTIDWGDNKAPIPLQGSFRNQRGSVATKCLPLQTTTNSGGGNQSATSHCVANVDGRTMRYGACTTDGDCGTIVTYVKCTAKTIANGTCDPTEVASEVNTTCVADNTIASQDVTQASGNYCTDGAGTMYNSCTTDTDCWTDPKPQCVAESKSPDFAHIVDKTCDNSYFHAENTYYCSPGSPNFTNSESQCGVAFRNGGCCIYYPRVQVMDNWGWCNGDCNGAGSGCYDNNDLKDPYGTNMCKTDAAWVYFGGSKGAAKVIVSP